MCLYEFIEHPLTEKWKFISRKNCPLNIGNGKEEYHTQLGTSFWNLYHTWWNLLREFDKACYPDLCKKSFNEKICNWAIMAATNERVDQINQNKGGLDIGQLLSLFKSTEFKTVHKHPYSQRNFWIPWLHLVCPLHILLLKRYFLIILIRNYNPKRRTSKWTHYSWYF